MTQQKEAIRPWIARLLISAGIAILVLIFVHDSFYPFNFFSRYRLSFIDRNFAHRAPLNIPKESLDVIIVTISDKSEATVPDRFPFPRSYYARAIRNLNRAGARAIGIDLTFDQPDETHGPYNDDELYRAIQQYRNVVVAGKTDLRDEEATVAREDENFHSIFYSADSSVGSVYVPNDVDGIYRRYMPFAKMPGIERYIPSFSFGLLNKVQRLPSTTIAENNGREFIVGNNHVPQFDDVSFLINYYGPAGSTFEQFDIANILDDSTFETVEERELHASINIFDDPDIGMLHDGKFKNKIVLIGPYFSESKDIFNVPIADPKFPDRNQMYGVEIHANALQTLLRQEYIQRPALWIDFLYIIGISFLTFFCISALKLNKSKYSFLFEILGVAFVFALLYGVLQLSYYMFSAHRILVGVVSPASAVILNYVGSVVYQYLSERKQKSMIKGMFSQYLNPTVVNELIQDPNKLRLGGEKKLLTVFFSDIASFTSFSEKLPPEELVLLMNEYLSSMTEIILKNEGTLDKYIGDAVMAFWGAPIPLENNALSACLSALEMQEKAQHIAERWKSEGRPNLVVRMGLNTAEMVVGNMGGEKRFDYTVLGDAVNLASRLEGANKSYGTRIMISEATYEKVKDLFLCRELDLLVVKGKTKPIRVYELLGKLDTPNIQSQRQLIEQFSLAMNFYRNQRFSDAQREFEKVLQLDSSDEPSALYIKRCKEFIQEPPPNDWNGVYEMKTK